MLHTRLQTKGFTLIELLVVIAIIALLSSVVLSSLNSARAKGSDARRIADMREIQKGIELYFDANGHYPDSNNKWTSFDSPIYSVNGIQNPAAANLGTALAPYIHMSGDPSDPVSSDAGYLYWGNPTNYCVLIYKTPQNMNDFASTLVPPRCGTISNGQCSSGANAIYVGVGTYAAGC